mmetsp:Transcript_12111/g.34651  ORF Transcript_12111/g.34651 Transcript_12111/m.34651 type:complete len:334 (+) Transcript_12111:697-1698(+)
MIPVTSRRTSATPASALLPQRRRWLSHLPMLAIPTTGDGLSVLPRLLALSDPSRWQAVSLPLLPTIAPRLDRTILKRQPHALATSENRLASGVSTSTSTSTSSNPRMHRCPPTPPRRGSPTMLRPVRWLGSTTMPTTLTLATSRRAAGPRALDRPLRLLQTPRPVPPLRRLSSSLSFSPPATTKERSASASLTARAPSKCLVSSRTRAIGPEAIRSVAVTSPWPVARFERDPGMAPTSSRLVATSLRSRRRQGIRFWPAISPSPPRLPSAVAANSMLSSITDPPRPSRPPHPWKSHRCCPREMSGAPKRAFSRRNPPYLAPAAVVTRPSVVPT